MILRFSILFWGMLILFSAVPPRGIAGSGPITLGATDEALENILDRLSEQSGYAIGVEPQWLDFPVTVDFKDASLDQAITAIFEKRLNHAVIWNEQEKTIRIMLYPLSCPSETGPAPEGKEIPAVSLESMPVPPPLNGRSIRFEQASRTTNY